MEIVNKSYIEWRDTMDKMSDPRTSDWLLVSSPFPTIIICICYVYIVKVNYTILLRCLYNFSNIIKLYLEQQNLLDKTQFFMSCVIVIKAWKLLVFEKNTKKT